MKEYVNHEAELVSLYFMQAVEGSENSYYNLSRDTLRPSSTHSVHVVDYSADFTRIIPYFELSQGARSDMSSGRPVNCEEGVFEITVTSEDGQFSRTYKVTLQRGNKPIPLPVEILESGAALTGFSLKEVPGALVTQDMLNIRCEIPKTVKRHALTPVFELSAGASVTYSRGFVYGGSYDFNYPLTVSVESEDKSARAVYTIEVEYPAAVIGTDAVVEGLYVTNVLHVKSKISGSRIFLEVPYGTPLQELELDYDLSAGATTDLPRRQKIDLSKPFDFRVVSEDGLSVNTYTLSAYHRVSDEIEYEDLRVALRIGGKPDTVALYADGARYVGNVPSDADKRSAHLLFSLPKGVGSSLNGTECSPVDSYNTCSGLWFRFSSLVDLSSSAHVVFTSPSGRCSQELEVVLREAPAGSAGAAGSRLEEIWFEGGGIKGRVPGVLVGTLIQAVVPADVDVSRLVVGYQLETAPLAKAAVLYAYNAATKKYDRKLESGKSEVDCSEDVSVECWRPGVAWSLGRYTIRIVRESVVEDERPAIEDIGFAGVASSIDIRQDTIFVNLPDGTDVRALRLEYKLIPDGATGIPASGSVLDFSKPQALTVRSAKRMNVLRYVVKAEPKLNDEADLQDIRIAGLPDEDRTEQGGSVSYRTLQKVDLKSLTLNFRAPRGATCRDVDGEPIVSGQRHDFSKPFTLTVESENGAMRRTYTVSVRVVLNSEAAVKSFSIKELSADACKIRGSMLLFGPLTTGQSAASLTPLFELSSGATSNLVSGESMDLREPVKLVVTSEDGNFTRTYTIMEDAGGLRYDFEQWATFGSGVKQHEIPVGWASGNTGIAISRGLSGGKLPPQFPTRRTTDAHGGSSAVVISTEELNMAGNRIAAGCCYLGQFTTSGIMSDPLSCTRFGEIWTNPLPDRFQGWYKYKPGPENRDGQGNLVSGQDEMSLFAVLYWGESLTGHNVEDSERIVAIARVPNRAVFEYTYFDIPFDYVRDIPAGEKLMFSIVLSSSRKGASFTGAIGSELIVDDLEITFRSRGR